MPGAPAERIRPSAAVILHRSAPHFEVYLVERSPRQRIFPGYHAFPGGTLDPAEVDLRSPDALDRFRRAALRELFEETGVLLCGPSPPPPEFPAAKLRAELEAKTGDLPAAAAAHGLRLAPERLLPAGRVITPPFGPTRYDNQFFLVELPQGQEPSVVPGELIAGRWWSPTEALLGFRREAMPIPPPTLAFLALLSRHPPEEAARVARATDGRPHHERFRVQLHPGIYVHPFRAPTLPPATTVNTYYIGGERDLVVVDPGTPFDDEREVLAYTVEDLLGDGRAPLATVLTHHHSDHVASAEFLRERFGLPVWAHAETAKLLGFGVDRTLRDDDVLDLGTDPGSGRPWRVRVLETPGHAPGHLALLDERFGALVAGDLVSGVSTILVHPPEGDMAAYMESLQRMADLRPRVVLPAHGPLIPGNVSLIQTLEHRRMREGKVLAALTATPLGLEALLPVVYDDTPREAWPLAELSLEAHLQKLARERKAVQLGDEWARMDG